MNYAKMQNKNDKIMIFTDLIRPIQAFMKWIKIQVKLTTLKSKKLKIQLIKKYNRNLVKMLILLKIV